MSIIKTISTLPDTKRNFDSPNNSFVLMSGIFVSKKEVLFDSIEDFQDYDKWIEFLESQDITPLHYIKEIEYKDEETQYAESLQNFSYKTRNGHYRQTIRYTYTIEKHQLIEQLSGTDLYVFYYDRNKNIYGTSDDGTTVRGFTANRLQLEKLIFGTDSQPAFSPLDIELFDSDELNVRGIVKKVSWRPTDIDRLFMSINIEYIDQDTLNFYATYRGDTIDTILRDDITITDEQNGVLSFNQYNHLGGVYQLSDFSLPLIRGKLEILSTLYLGCVSYLVQVVVTPIAVNFDFEDGVNYQFEDSINFEFEN